MKDTNCFYSLACQKVCVCPCICFEDANVYVEDADEDEGGSLEVLDTNTPDDLKINSEVTESFQNDTRNFLSEILRIAKDHGYVEIIEDIKGFIAKRKYFNKRGRFY